ncbi:MAG TPA: hypothetical protein VLA97_01765 [Nocardioidaceae bacterium]|nr:hypothetical protein [Nocardioidaceae bacterium]
MQTNEVRRSTRFGTDSATMRAGSVALALGVVLPLAATAVHPHREDVMDNPAVFTEYAESTSWIAVHLAQWGAALLLFAGLMAVHHALRTGSGPARALARFGLFATVQAAAAITALQAVDGVALKWATEAWVGAQGPEKTAAFAAAETVRWTELGFQSYSNILLGLALVLLGLATLAGSSYPRWLGALATGSGGAWIVHGVMVSYVGFFDSTPRLVGMALLAPWGLAMGVLMWRDATRGARRPGDVAPPAARPTLVGDGERS